MGNHDLQFFSPLAISELSVGLNSFDLRQFTLPHYLSPDHKERLVALLLGALCSHTSDSPGELLNSLIRLRWEDREWVNAQQPPAVRLGQNDVLWLIVETSVPERELLAFADTCNCLVLIDLRLPHRVERVEWMAKLKLALLDAVQKWWGQNVSQAEAKQVDYRDAGEWFDSPIDALDYCNTVAAGLFKNHSLVYIERQAMAAVLASRAKALQIESVIALVAFALRERWQQLRFSEPMPLPDFAGRFSEWQSVGLGWHVGAEFVPLNAVERLQEREVLDPFFTHWERESEANAQLFNFWDKLRTAMAPPEPTVSTMPAPDTTLRPPESMVSGGTSGTPESIRRDIAGFFPSLLPEANDSTLQDTLIKESDENHRLLLLAWRASLWLDKAGDRNTTASERLRAENDVTRAIKDVWSRLNLKAEPAQPAFAVAKNWARLRTALADHLRERARVGDSKKLFAQAGNHYSKSLATFQSLKIKPQEANVLKAMGDLLMRVDDLGGARASYEKALPIFRQIEDRLGEANVLKAMGDLLMRVADLGGARASYEKALPIFRQIEARLGEANVLQAMGDLLMRVDDLGGARASYEKALPIFRQIEDRLGEANVLKAMGDLLMRVADLGGARASYEKALPIFRQIEDRLGEANVLKAMGDLLMRVADLGGARASYEKALPIYSQIEARLGEANVLKAMGDLLMRVADLGGARASYEKALPIFRQIEDRLGEANVLQAMGDLLMRVADLGGARASYEKALPIFRQIEARLGEANVLQAMGDLLMRVADLGGARASYEKALPIYSQIEARLGEANVLQAMGNLAMAEEMPDEAERYLGQALKFHATLSNLLGVGAALGYLARVAMGREKFGRALILGEYGLAIFRAIEDRFGQALTLGTQGQGFLAMGLMEPALAAWWQAFTIFREIGDPSAERLAGIFGQVESQVGKEEFGLLMTALQSQSEEMRLAGVAEARQVAGDDELIREITEQLKKLEGA